MQMNEPTFEFLWVVIHQNPDERRPYNQVSINCKEFEFTDEKSFRNNDSIKLFVIYDNDTIICLGQKNDPTFPKDKYNNDGMPEYTLTPDV